MRNDSSVHPLIGDITLTGIFIFEGIVISLMSEARYETEEQKDEFLGFAAHELKNPLSSIKGYIGLILKQVKKDDEKIASYAKSVDHQIDRIVELINDFLDVTKIEIGKFSYKDEYFIIDTLVKDIVEHQRMITQNRLLELKGFSKKVVLGDKYRIGQVLINLITNATKYSPEHSKILIHIAKKNHFVTISVRDKGIGIPPKEQKKIFTQFFRTSSAEKGNIQGLGLGLYIVDQIIKHYHGSLWVKSKLGKGSTFFVHLPTQ